MHRLATLLAGVAAAIVLNTSASELPVASPGNPYAVIGTRNIFGLAPPEPPVVAPAAVSPPPAVILPNGIIFLFGKLQVLFKVPGAAGDTRPSRESSYLLGEGERQDEIQVLHIDEKNGVVTFNNHGVVQEIPLPSLKNPGDPMPAGAGPGRPQFVGAIGHGRIPPYFLDGEGQTGPAQIPASKDEQMRRIEALRAFYKSHNDPRADTLPPTALMPDPANAAEPAANNP